MEVEDKGSEKNRRRGALRAETEKEKREKKEKEQHWKP